VEVVDGIAQLLLALAVLAVALVTTQELKVLHLPLVKEMMAVLAVEMFPLTLVEVAVALEQSVATDLEVRVDQAVMV
jgi:hypothetical protein